MKVNKGLGIVRGIQFFAEVEGPKL